MNEIVKEAKEAVEKGLPCGFLVPKLLEVIESQTAEIEILIRKKETLRDELAEKDAEIDRLKHILVAFMNEVENWEHKHGIDTSNIPKIAVLGTEKENCIRQAKSEAYREFAEKAIQTVTEFFDYQPHLDTKEDVLAHTFRILKELARNLHGKQ